jgi:hypothetical protein
MITIHFWAFKCLLIGLSTLLNELKHLEQNMSNTYVWESNHTTQYKVPSKNTYDAFTLDVKSMLNKNLGGILGGTQC